MALFVLVGGLVEVGVVGSLGTYAAELMGDNELAGVTGLMIGSAVVGGFVDNIPYTAAMVPIVEEMVAATPSSGADSPLWCSASPPRPATRSASGSSPGTASWSRS